jgi:hypothetical protein
MYTLPAVEEERNRSEAQGAPARPRKGWVIALLIVASVVLFLASFAVWADRQLLETDTWVETSSELLDNDDVKDALAPSLVDALFENVDVEGEIEAGLPEEVQGLAGPAAGAVRELANQAAREVLDQGLVLSLWETANRATHETMLAVVEGGGERISTEGGVVALNLSPLVEEVGTRTGIDVAGAIPDDAAQIEILQSDELSLVQDAVDLLQTISWVLVVIALALFTLAIYLARGWRREALRASGWAFIAVGALILIVRSILGGVVVGELTTTESNEPAVSAVWAIGTSALEAIGIGLIFYGVIGVIGTWLAGSTSAAIEVRRSLTPAFRERSVAYALLAAIIIVLFLISPAEGTERLGPSLVLIVLLVAGFEVLRRQSLREFPAETWEAASERWRARLPGAGEGEAAQERTAEDTRLEQLERLGKLRETGVLDAEELEREKRRLLGSE